MSEEQNSTISWIKAFSGVFAVAIVAIAAYFIVTDLSEKDKAFEIQVDKAGKVAIVVSADDSFSEVFKKAIDADASEVDAILVSRQYYKLTNAALADGLAKLDPSQPDSQEISNMLRSMLWDLRGPFSLPGTLRGADERIIAALDDLDAAIKEAKEAKNSKEASALLAELWKLTLDRTGIFRPRFFEATVEIVQRAATGDEKYMSILACPGSALVSGRVMLLYTAHSNILVEVTQDTSLFDCGGAALTAEQLLAGGTARLGLSETAFRRLVDPTGEAGVGDGKGYAKFELFPRDLVSAFQWKEGA